jgi:hypothetical protein
MIQSLLIYAAGMAILGYGLDRIIVEANREGYEEGYEVGITMALRLHDFVESVPKTDVHSES